MAKFLVLFPCLLMITLAWGRNGGLDISRYQRSGESRMEQNCQVYCDSVVWNSRHLSNGRTLKEGLVVVCLTPDQLCYTSQSRKCCKYTGREGVVTNQMLTLGSRKINITVLFAGGDESCVFFGSDNSAVRSCSSTNKPFFRPEICSPSPTYCTNNSAGVCDLSGCLNCKEGYVEPSCCNCDNEYERAEDGSCKLICTVNCNGPLNNLCSSCAYPYERPPFCCDCAPPCVKTADGFCDCPQSQMEASQRDRNAHVKADVDASIFTLLDDLLQDLDNY